MEDEKNYIIFVFGFDLLNEYFLNDENNECDIVYKKCQRIADDFIKSEFNVDTKSLYDCLVDYVESKRYIDFIYDKDELEKDS